MREWISDQLIGIHQAGRDLRVVRTTPVGLGLGRFRAALIAGVPIVEGQTSVVEF